LTFDLLTLKLVRIIVRGIRSLLSNFDVSGTFRSRLMGQHLSDAPRDIATLTFDLAADGPSRRYWSEIALEFREKFGPQKTRIMGLPGSEEDLRPPSVQQV